MTIASSIKSLPFGDKGAIARTLTSKGTEKTAQIIVNAVLPMLSNMAIGHKTFSPVFSKGYKGSCPLCLAVAALKGKGGLARDVAFAEVTKATNQAHHDAMMESAELAIMAVYAPVVREKTDRTDWKALCAELEAKLQACQIDLAECQSELTEYKQAKKFVTRDRAMLNAALARIQSMDTVIQRMGDQSTIDKACEGLDFPTMMISLED